MKEENRKSVTWSLIMYIVNIRIRHTLENLIWLSTTEIAIGSEKMCESYHGLAGKFCEWIAGAEVD